MLFSVEADLGDEITGYLVPDSFSGIGKITVSVAGQDVATLETQDPRPALVEARRHETGLCGFKIDNNVVPNLKSIEDLAIRATESDVMIYRRPSCRFIARKIIRIETHLLPLNALDNAFRNSFQFYYGGVEKYGRETIDQLFYLNAKSLYIGGRFLIKGYEYLIGENTEIVTMLREPHRELAERILLLRHASSIETDILNMRDNFMFQSALEFAQELDLRDVRSLKRAFKRIPSAAAMTFSNPLTKTFSAQAPDEPTYDGSIAAALSMLASCKIVGLRSHPDLFSQLLSELVGLDASAIPRIPEYDSVIQLGDQLAQIKEVNLLLERDIELYGSVLAAFEKSQ